MKMFINNILKKEKSKKIKFKTIPYFQFINLMIINIKFGENLFIKGILYFNKSKKKH
jgi:hypothetical protein